MIAILLAAAIAGAEPAEPAASTPAAATTVSPATVPAPAAKPPGEKLVCWMEAPSGSHEKQKLCATEAQLDRSRRNAQDYVKQKKFELTRGLGN